MKRIVSAVAVCLAAFAGLCAQNASIEAEARIVPGSTWSSRMWIGIIPMKKTPQYAFWIETEDGEFVRTLAVTNRSAKGEWRGAPEGGRPDSLPVWSHAAARGASDGAEEVDAASSATPAGGGEIRASSGKLEAGKRYRARFEINASFDYNDAWPKKAREGEPGWSGVNGQPSVVYEAVFSAGEGGEIVLKPAGQGAIDGSDGEMRIGLEGVDSALFMVESASLLLK